MLTKITDSISQPLMEDVDSDLSTQHDQNAYQMQTVAKNSLRKRPSSMLKSNQRDLSSPSEVLSRTAKVARCCMWERNLIRNIPIVFALIGIITGLGYVLADIFFLHTYYQIVPSGLLIMSSVILLIVGSIAKEIQVQVDRFKQENAAFRENLQQEDEEIKTMQAENSELKKSIADLGKTLALERTQLHSLEEENATFVLNLKKEQDNLQQYILQTDTLRKENADLNAVLVSERKQIDLLAAANMSFIESEGKLRGDLSALSGDLQREKDNFAAAITATTALQNELEESKTLITSLRAFQKKSVEIIQVLSLYGDEAKATGMSLKIVAQDLLQTDHTLHDNVEALGAKLQVLDTMLEAHAATSSANK